MADQDPEKTYNHDPKSRIMACELHCQGFYCVMGLLRLRSGIDTEFYDEYKRQNGEYESSPSTWEAGICPFQLDE